MLNHIKSFKHTKCYDFSDERAKYFEWHNNFHQKLSKNSNA